MINHSDSTKNGRGEKTYWLDKPESVTLIYRGVWVICGLLAVADFVSGNPAAAHQYSLSTLVETKRR